MATGTSSDIKRRGTWPMHQGSSPQKKTQHAFSANGSMKDLERLTKARKDEGIYGVNLTILYLGLATSTNDSGQISVAFSSSDGTYNVDFAVHCLEGQADKTENRTQNADMLADYLVDSIRNYTHDHFYKFAGAGITKALADMSPNLCPRLWAELDIVPLVFERGIEDPLEPQPLHGPLSVDEEADSMARKCLMFFGPTQQPRIQIGFRNRVEVDVSGHARLTGLDDYRRSVHPRTWAAAMKYVTSLRERNVKIAFFSSTPLGGGVALMRHALMRFFRVVGVDCKWFVPKPKPEVFRVTKTNHNILQGVAKPEERLSKDQQRLLAEWVESNAKTFWLSEGGSLLAPSAGGADVVIVDDPQMPDLVRLAKEQDPDRPVCFRSHIQIRSDLADQAGTPTSEVWQWLWDRVKGADVFISHPVREFVPSAVDFKKVGYMPATTDWLDGLNKQLSTFDTEYYIHEFNTECYKQRMTKLAFPSRPYIVQIARFDPSKGLPDVLAAYAELRHKHMNHLPADQTPQLVLAGHGAVDDPDASMIYDQTLDLLDTTYADLRGDVVVMRVGPTDQILNALMANARVALQLSTREGFEVKVSEALHKGIPIVASRAGGIPLQVVHGKGGYVVETGDYKAVARHLFDLLTDEALYREMSGFAAAHVSDEVGTVGNALAWMYLADALSKGETVRPDSAWINDLAREGAGVPYEEGETRLPRDKKLNLG